MVTLLAAVVLCPDFTMLEAVRRDVTSNTRRLEAVETRLASINDKLDKILLQGHEAGESSPESVSGESANCACKDGPTKRCNCEKCPCCQCSPSRNCGCDPLPPTPVITPKAPARHGVLYTTPSCVPCRLLKQDLVTAGIDFDEVDGSHLPMVPVFKINGKTIVGRDLPSVMAAIGDAPAATQPIESYEIMTFDEPARTVGKRRGFFRNFGRKFRLRRQRSCSNGVCR